MIPARAHELSTAEISDALDALRLPGSVLGIGHVAGRVRVFGRAYTVRYGPVDVAKLGTVGDYLALRGIAVPPINGDILRDDAGSTETRLRKRLPIKKAPCGAFSFGRLAESEGFEPSMQVLPTYSLSRGAPSATRSRLQHEVRF
jgi:hypothetical protein